MAEDSAHLTEAGQTAVADQKDSRPFVEKHSWILFSIVVLLFLSLVVVQSQSKLLWHDELIYDTTSLKRPIFLPCCIRRERLISIHPSPIFL